MSDIKRKVMYCPCCKEEFSEEEKFCCDCFLPLVDNMPSQTDLCDCDNIFPLGTCLAYRLRNSSEDVIAEISNLTGITDDVKLQEYIDRILFFNEEEE